MTPSVGNVLLITEQMIDEGIISSKKKSLDKWFNYYHREFEFAHEKLQLARTQPGTLSEFICKNFLNIVQSFAIPDRRIHSNDLTEEQLLDDLVEMKFPTFLEKYKQILQDVINAGEKNDIVNIMFYYEHNLYSSVHKVLEHFLHLSEESTNEELPLCTEAYHLSDDTKKSDEEVTPQNEEKISAENSIDEQGEKLEMKISQAEEKETENDTSKSVQEEGSEAETPELSSLVIVEQETNELVALLSKPVEADTHAPELHVSSEIANDEELERKQKEEDENNLNNLLAKMNLKKDEGTKSEIKKNDTKQQKTALERRKPENDAENEVNDDKNESEKVDTPIEDQDEKIKERQEVSEEPSAGTIAEKVASEEQEQTDSVKEKYDIGRKSENDAENEVDDDKNESENVDAPSQDQDEKIEEGQEVSEEQSAESIVEEDDVIGNSIRSLIKQYKECLTKNSTLELTWGFEHVRFVTKQKLDSFTINELVNYYTFVEKQRLQFIIEQCDFSKDVLKNEQMTNEDWAYLSELINRLKMCLKN